MPVAAVQQSFLSVLEGDLCFPRAVNFNLPSNTEDLIRAVTEDDLLDGDIEMMCHGLILTRHGAASRERRVEELLRLEHELQEASISLEQIVDANTTYKKKLCAQVVERELDAARIAELEKLEVDKATENV